MSENPDFFIRLLWDDILCSHILPRLTLKEIFILRGLSTAYRTLVDTYLGKITTLNLQVYNVSFNEAAMKVITDKCKNLRSVNLSGCHWLKDHMVIPLFLNNRNITELNLAECDRLTTVCLQPVMVLCKNLQKLSLSGCMWINSGCLEAFVLHQSLLREINLDRCYHIENDTLSYFLSKFPRISTSPINLQVVASEACTVKKGVSPKTKYIVATYSQKQNQPASVSLFTETLPSQCYVFVESGCTTMECVNVLKCLYCKNMKYNTKTIV